MWARSARTSPGQDLGLLIGCASAAADVPFPGLRDDLWKRYLQIILDGLRPGGRDQAAPRAPPARKLFESSATADS